MKVGSFVSTAGGAIENVKIFVPCQTILLVKKDSLGYVDFVENFVGKVQVELQNSANGTRVPLIPFIKITELAEIATFNEGAVVCDSASNLVLPIMLNPVGNVKIDNDKYLELNFTDLGDTQNYDIYAFESGQMSDFQTKYQKLACPVGISRQKFPVTDSDIVAFPRTGFDSIQLTYKGGLVSVLTPTELEYLMCKTNDITFYQLSASGNIAANTGAISGNPEASVAVNVNMKMGYSNYYIMNLLGVDQIEVIRDSNSNAVFEFVLADLIK